MENALIYPTLRLGLLQNLAQLRDEYARDPEFLSATTCPYDNQTIEILKGLFKIEVVDRIVEKKVIVPEDGGKRGPRAKAGLSVEDQDEIATELRGLLDTLKTMDDGEKTLDTSVRLQIVKTRASLIEQLIKGLERIYNVKQVSNFQSVVIAILDDLVDETGREAFLRRVEPYRD